VTVLRVSGLEKTFIQHTSELRRVLSWFGLPTASKNRKNVLVDISLELRAGEALGLVGLNGAGKSTLLKIIAGVLKPSAGTILVRGRIAALLELGMGFNPELTAEQNVIHAAGLMGFSKKEIDLKLPEIEAFAEIGDYFRQPLRVYSSGMQARVAFAVATAWRPDILIIDEALSVGDSYFQQKSFRRIEEMKALGTALLLVSHDKSAILKLCEKVMLLSDARVKIQGIPEAVMNAYNALLADMSCLEENEAATNSISRAMSSGNGQFSVTNVRLLSEKNLPISSVEVGQKVALEIEVQINTPDDDLTIGYEIKDRLGYSIFGTNSYHHKTVIDEQRPGSRFKIRFYFAANLGPGSYSISTALHSGPTHIERNYEWQDLAFTFEVLNINHKFFTGSCWMEPSVEVLR